MKTFFLLFSSCAISGVAMSQNVQNAKDLIYYERYKSAANALQTIVKTDSLNAEAWYWLSQAHLLPDDTAKLHESLQNCSPQVKNEPWHQVAMGHLWLYKNNADSARFYFDKALDKTKEKDADILLAIANAHVATKTGDANYAVQLLEKGVKREKKNAVLFTRMGDAYRKQGNGSEAYKKYQAALDNDNKYAGALYRMGKIFVSQKNAEMYLKYFNQVIQADSNYAPALYEMYYHYYFNDAPKALAYFQQYLSKSDFKTINAYLYTDLLYLNKKYQPAIDIAQNLLNTKTGDSIPRLYKLMAYSYMGLNDSSKAISWMNRYFTKEADSNFVAKDFETMAELYSATGGNEDSALAYYVKAVQVLKDPNARNEYYKKLADMYSKKKDYANQATWLGRYYQENAKANNIDLFNWGVANFKAENYVQADTVFGLYTQKYPEQAFGYYWRARSNSLRDSAMEKGLAVPHYNQLIGIIEKDTANKTNKKWLVEAYGYLAAYETNQVKDYKTALEKLQKILELDPQNKDAQQYISILEKKISSGSSTENSSSTANTGSNKK